MKFTQDPAVIADKLSKGLRNKAIRIAINKAAAVIKAAVVSLAPKRYGYLQKSIKIKVKNYQEKAVWVAIIGPKSDFIRNKGVRHRGPYKGDPIRHRPSKYAKLLELGTKRAAARPFLKPALEQNQEQYVNIVTKTLSDQVAKLLPQK